MTTPSTDVALRTSGTSMQVGAGQMQAHELALIEQQANMLAGSSIVPRAFKGKPADIVAVASIGREVGLSPMASMQSIHIIEGKPTMSAQLMGALIRGRGHSLRIERLDNDGCTMVGVRADTGDTMSYSFTREDAKAAGLLGKQVWKSYFQAMSLARCTSQIARTLFADVLAGISYTPEEGAAIAGVDVRVDAEGEVVEIQGEVIPTRAAPAPTATRRRAPAAETDPDTAEPTPELVSKARHAELVSLVQQLADDDKPGFQGWSKGSGIKWKPDTMTVEMGDAVEAKLHELLGIGEEPAEALEGELIDPVEDLDALAAEVAAAQTSPRRKAPAA